MTTNRNTYQIFKVDDVYVAFLKQCPTEDKIIEIKTQAKDAILYCEFEASSWAERYIIYDSILGNGREALIVSVEDYMR